MDEKDVCRAGKHKCRERMDAQERPMDIVISGTMVLVFIIAMI